MSLLEIRTLDKIVDLYHSIVKGDDAPPDSGGDFHIVKDATGKYKWLAVYSNSFRDNDGVPEIIGSKSHKAFVDGVNAGVYDYPDLVLWHNLKWKFGKATVVAYDEVEPGITFAIAGGDIDVGKEYVAEALLESGVEWKNSHGMPTSEIRREFIDSTVYAKHVTTEITVLPAEYAANPLTGFGLLGEKNMIPDEQKAEIMGKLGISASVIESIEASNKAVTDTEKDTREYKEIDVDEQTEDVEVQTEAAEAATVTEPVTEEVGEQVQDIPVNPGLDVQAILDANKETANAVETLGSDVKEIKDSLDIVASALETLSIAQKNLNERVDATEQAQKDEVIAQTPTFSASFKDRIDSIIGQPAAVVSKEKGKGEDLGDGPKEAKSSAEINKAFGSSFLGDLVSKGS